MVGFATSGSLSVPRMQVTASGKLNLDGLIIDHSLDNVIEISLKGNVSWLVAWLVMKN